MTIGGLGRDGAIGILPRRLRLESPGAIYQVMRRGDGREDTVLNLTLTNPMSCLRRGQVDPGPGFKVTSPHEQGPCAGQPPRSQPLLSEKAIAIMFGNFTKLVTEVGTFALYALAGLVLIMIFISIMDRHSRGKSKPKDDPSDHIDM